MNQDEAATTEGTAERRLLLVHGHDFKPAEEVLLDLSIDALRSGIARDYGEQVATFDSLGVDIAYYGDLNNSLLLGGKNHYDEVLDVGDRRNALKELKEMKRRKNFRMARYDRVPGKSAIPELIADVAGPVFGALGLTRLLARLVSRDFAAYLDRRSEYGASVRARIRDRITAAWDRGETLSILSHGTGSVPVYDVLWQLTYDERFHDKYSKNKVDLWITAGSPLSDNGLRKRLHGASNGPERRYPQNVISWHNLSAEDDYLCHDMTLADDFHKMLKQHRVSAVIDHRIYNFTVRYGKSNPHCSLGYFIHPRMSRIVADWLGLSRVDDDPKGSGP